MGNTRQHRRDRLRRIIEQDPFQTDQQLAEKLHVSVATIRLDRMALGIPELRERTRNLAAENHAKLRAIEGHDIIGELIQIELGVFGISILQVTSDMVFERTGITRGHFLFAQGNSLAVAVVNAQMALTAAARVRFVKPVYLHDRIVAKASVSNVQGNRYIIEVESRVGGEVVFRGDFEVASLIDKELIGSENSG